MADKLNLNFKIWLEQDGKVFGEGPSQLLEGIRDHGSLRQAAADMNMSYSLAHKLIKNLERRLGYALVERTVGGSGGGGSRLTPQADDLMRRYHAFMREAQDALQTLFERHFPGEGDLSGR